MARCASLSHLRPATQISDLFSISGDHKAHGLWADGSAAALNGTSVGLWTVFNNLEGYTGGPLRSDLVVDTNIYNCELVGGDRG